MRAFPYLADELGCSAELELEHERTVQDDAEATRRHSEMPIALADNHARRYYCGVIVSFRDADTEARANGHRIARFTSIESVARRKLRQLQIAGRLNDLRVLPGNRLEALRGDRAGQYSIRVNDHYRVCFRWTTAGPEDVEIVDYH